MCDPISVIAGAGMAVSAIGTAKSIKAQAAAGRAQAQVAGENARMLDEQAEARLEKAKFDIDTVKRAYERDRGNKLSRIGASGVDTSSFFDVLADDTGESFLERKAIQYNADAEAANLRFQAWGERQGGQSAVRAANANIEATLIDGVSNVLKIGGNTFGGSSRPAASGWTTTTRDASGRLK
jgi:hypothetical protein